MMRINRAKRMYYNHQIIGVSSRLHEIQAAILRVKFKYLKQNLEHRQKIAEEYSRFLGGVGDLILPATENNSKRVYNYYVIRIRHRDGLNKFLTDSNIKTSILYPTPLHLLRAFKFLNYKIGDFSEAEKAAKQIICLPIHEFLPLRKVKAVADLIRKFFNKG